MQCLGWRQSPILVGRFCTVTGTKGSLISINGGKESIVQCLAQQGPQSQLVGWVVQCLAQWGPQSQLEGVVQCLAQEGPQS